MDGLWLPAPHLAKQLGISLQAVHKRLRKLGSPSRKRSWGKGFEFDVTDQRFPSDWRERISAKLEEEIPARDCDEAPQPKAEKGFRIVIEVRFEEL